MGAQSELWTALPFDELSDEVKAVVVGNDRQTNIIATPEWLATLTTCCLCGGPMDPIRRYLCQSCSEDAL